MSTTSQLARFSLVNMANLKLFTSKKNHILQLVTRRGIQTTQKLAHRNTDHYIKNFREFKYPNQVSTFEHYNMPEELLQNEFSHPICRDTMGIRWPGYWFKRRFVYVKEMEPELVVPDLEDFDLKPYVSYRTEEVDTQPLTAKDLFRAVYSEKIASDYMEGKLEDYDVKSEEIDEARLKAMQTGSDLFESFTYEGVRAPIRFVKDP